MTNIKTLLSKSLNRIGQVILSLVLATSCLANDGKAVSIPAKATVPLTYYEGLMITVAAVYGIYLVIRAYRRKRNNQNITE